MFIALLIALSCVISVGAADFPSFVVDYTKTLSQDELHALNELSDVYYKKYNTEISYALFEGNNSEEIITQSENLKPATDAENRILLAVNDDYWYVVSSGTIGDSINDDVEETFFNVSAGNDRYDGIQSYITEAGNYVSDFFDEPETETTKTETTTAVSSADSSLKNLPKPSNSIKKGDGFTGKYPHIMDTAKLLSKEDVSSLEEKLSKISEQQKLEIVVVTTQDSEGFEVSDYTGRIFSTCDYGYGKTKDGILLLLSMKERDWYIATHGYGKTVLSDRQVESVGKKIVPALSAGNYANAFSSFADECNNYAEKATVVSLKNLPKPSNSIKKGDGFTGKYPHIMDTAKLLSKEDVSSLEEKLSKISEQQKLEIVVVTTQDSEGFEVSDYTGRIFSTCDYGYGKTKDGILLLLSMKERDWYIATHGYGKTVLSDRQVESVGKKIVPALSAGNYANAFSSFADECNNYIEAAKNGNADYDSDGSYSRAPLPITALPICFGIGLIIALIIVGIMKRKLKTAVRQKEANNYVKDGSFRVTESYDQFLYSNVTQTRISRDDNDSYDSGSSSSSDSSFGGGGGKF